MEKASTQKKKEDIEKILTRVLDRENIDYGNIDDRFANDNGLRTNHGVAWGICYSSFMFQFV
jgi:hypothetical protein